MSPGDKVSDAAERLFAAERDVAAIEPLTDEWPEMTIDEAYQVQMINVNRRTEAGEVIRGHKIGFTSKAMQRQLGVDIPDYGHLLDGMFCLEEEEVPAASLLFPRIEPEIAFILSRDLEGPGVSAADVMQATDFIVPSLEIIDSRVVDWRIKIQDTIADNASAARVVLSGRPHSLRGLDLPNTPVVLRKAGKVVETAAGAAVLGNPVSAIVWLVNALGQFGVVLEAGHVVLSGSFCTSVFVEPGESVTATFGELGSVSSHFTA